MKKIIILILHVGFIFQGFSQKIENKSEKLKQISASEIITLKSIPAPSDIIWQGGERTQTIEWDKSTSVSNISVPTITAFLPEPSKANGTAIVIAPGGGFHVLSMDYEGNYLAQWCAEHGIAAFVLKYRLWPTGENPGKEFMDKMQKDQKKLEQELEPLIKLSNADALSAIEYVRLNAVKYNVNPQKIGIIGFSAGGTVAANAGLNYTSNLNRPDFFAPIYGAIHVLNLNKLAEKPMPLFMVVASDDFFNFQNYSVDLFKSYNAAKQPVELHIYEKGNHGFGVKKQGFPCDDWINVFQKWLGSHGFL